MAASTAKPEDTRVVEIQTGSNSVVNTPSPSKVWDGKISEAEKQYEEELSNSLEPDVVVAPQPSSNSKHPPVSGQKVDELVTFKPTVWSFFSRIETFLLKLYNMVDLFKISMSYISSTFQIKLF